jgi:hypothetical protein
MQPRVLIVLVALGVLVAGIVLWRGTARTPPHEPGNPSASSALDPQARVALLDSSLRALGDGYREMPRDTWDLDYVVRMVGRDPQRLFAWVQDNTYWIPYKGVLRGPVGVLLDRQGNSLDRAILLAALLQKAGYTARLAHGTLEPQEALELLPRLEVERTLNLATHSPGAAVQADANLQRQQQQFAHVATELRSRVADQTERLLHMTVSPDPSTMRMRALDSATQALSDHWWVQFRNGTDWVDLDLLAASPHALAEARETFAITDLPPELHHTVTVRVIAEQWSQGTLKEHKALEQVLRPSDLYGHPVSLQFWPSAWFEDDAPGQRHTRAEALKLDSWNAMLAVDQNLLAAGILTANGDDPHAPVKGGEFGGFAGAFESSMGQKPGNENRQLSAVWLEYEIHVPGEKPRVVRRSVFDLLGPAARATSAPTLALDESRRLTRSLALTMKTEILPISCGLSPEFVTALLARNLIASRDLMSFLISGEMPAATTDTESLLRQSAPPMSTLYGLALARGELSRKGQVFIDRPNILTRHLYAAPTADGVALLDATDIVANEVDVGLSVSDPFAARVEQGVLDTNAESLFRPGKDPALNTGDAFAASRSWTGLQSRQVTATDVKLNLPQDVRDRVRSDLGNGYDVVVPERPIATDAGQFAGWWRVDPATGDVLGMGENGWGVVMAERTAEDSETVKIAPLWVRRIQTFAVAFAVNYGWCVVPLVVKRGEDYLKQPAEAWGIQGTQVKLHHSLGIWEGAIKPVAKDSVGECAADSIWVAGLTAWLLPVGVAAGAAKAAERGSQAPHAPDVEGGLGAGGGSGVKGGDPGAGKTKPGPGPNEPANGPKGEPNPEPKPPSEKPCDNTLPGEPPAEPPGQGPEGPPARSDVAKQLQEQVWLTEHVALDSEMEFAKANSAMLQYRNQPTTTRIYNARGDVIGYEGPNFDPKVYAELVRVADVKFKIAVEASARSIDAARAWDKFVGNPYQAHHRFQTKCAAGPPAESPQPISKLDPALYDPQFENTQPAYGQPGTDPLAKTQPGYGQPGTDPLAKTQPGYGDPRSGKTLPGIGPPGSTLPEKSRPCRWCSYLPPVYPDTDPNSKPPGSTSSGNYQQNTLNGLSGVGAAFGGAPK